MNDLYIAATDFVLERGGIAQEITAVSATMRRWVGESHTWKAIVAHRVKGGNCPECTSNGDDYNI